MGSPASVYSRDINNNKVAMVKGKTEPINYFCPIMAVYTENLTRRRFCFLQIKFPVLANKFPIPSEEIPVPFSRRFGSKSPKIVIRARRVGRHPTEPQPQRPDLP